VKLLFDQNLAPPPIGLLDDLFPGSRNAIGSCPRQRSRTDASSGAGGLASRLRGNATLMATAIIAE
jgi:hypothetical protein